MVRPLAIKIVLPQAIIDRLHQRATLMGISPAELAADLLKEIARDDLYDAVLDRDDTEVIYETRDHSNSGQLAHL